ncbi:hypothetical protein GGQ73_003384 [Rhizobium skierniewicense]|uniref:Uncharacterized protein n=1 Tax=Rhizobium skierniewicense TaxID=984260 RepID=A0A7W6CCP3_9HYPH|nr:hypothetical protein [Rhizobium skierniewicense]
MPPIPTPVPLCLCPYAYRPVELGCSLGALNTSYKQINNQIVLSRERRTNLTSQYILPNINLLIKLVS